MGIRQGPGRFPKRHIRHTPTSPPHPGRVLVDPGLACPRCCAGVSFCTMATPSDQFRSAPPDEPEPATTVTPEQLRECLRQGAKDAAAFLRDYEQKQAEAWARCKHWVIR